MIARQPSLQHRQIRPFVGPKQQDKPFQQAFPNSPSQNFSFAIVQRLPSRPVRAAVDLVLELRKLVPRRRRVSSCV